MKYSEEIYLVGIVTAFQEMKTIGIIIHRKISSQLQNFTKIRVSAELIAYAVCISTFAHTKKKCRFYG